MSAVLQRLTDGFAVEWLASIDPLEWAGDGQRAHVFSDQDAEIAARQLSRLTGRRVLPVTRAVCPRRLFFAGEARRDWRDGKANCGLE